MTTVQGLPKKFDQKKILKVIKKAFACNGTIVSDTEMGEVIQLQGDQRKDVQEFLCDKKEGLGLDAKTIKVSFVVFKCSSSSCTDLQPGPRFLNVQQPRHAPSSGTRDQPMDYHDVCSSSNRQQGAHCHDPHGFFSTTLTNFTRHDICYRQHHHLLTSWRGYIGVAQDTQPASTAAAIFLRIARRLFLYFFGRVFLFYCLCYAR